MNRTQQALPLRRLAELDLAWCLRLNRASQQRNLEQFFAIISRLGDGVFWYTLMLILLAMDGQAALPAVARMLVAGASALILYKWLKAHTTRPRPSARHDHIRASVAPLDEYSFPSGHTLHAVSFSIVAIYHYPMLAWLVGPFTVLVALSRMVLGLHYPSDVLAGALLGSGLALLALQL
jgi:undecaprenyl-diphosphatase